MVVLDVRSLALCRILLGCYLLYDIYSRLSLGRVDLAWYTSTGYLDPRDTPHGAPLHRIWFHRGSEAAQVALFASSFALAALFATGALAHRHPALNSFIKVMLWASVTSYQNRNMHVHDGSDSFVRHVLWWSLFLPLHEVWVVGRGPRRLSRNNTASESPSSPSSLSSVSTLACSALALQIALMYWGTVANRTLDAYGWRSLHKSEWMPPDLSAVHYALSGDFAVRNHALAQWVRHHALLTRTMTAAAMIVETLAPLLCLVDAPHRRHLHALQLFVLHLGLLLLIRLPNWQLVGMLTQVVWIPTNLWDAVLPEQQRVSANADPVAWAKKTDATLPDAPLGASSSSTDTKPGPRRNLRRTASLAVQSFFVVYMVYNWCGTRGWIDKHDNGDVGEGLRLSQHWVMYGTVSHQAHNVRLTGTLRASNGGTRSDAKPASRKVDLLRYLGTGELIPPPPSGKFLEDMSDRYPSPRWERALAQWAARNDLHRGQLLCRKLCQLVTVPLGENSSSSLAAVELRYDHAAILPPGSVQRYDPTQLTQEPVAVTIPCR